MYILFEFNQERLVFICEIEARLIDALRTAKAIAKPDCYYVLVYRGCLKNNLKALIFNDKAFDIRNYPFVRKQFWFYQLEAIYRAACEWKNNI